MEMSDYEFTLESLNGFVRWYESFRPSVNDMKEARMCAKMADPTGEAMRQLRRIGDMDRFACRLKAMLRVGICVKTFKGTIYETLECPELHEWLDEARQVYADSKIPQKLKDRRITRIGAMLTMS